MTLDYPKIRFVEASPVRVNGQRLICLRDPENLSGNVLFVAPEAAYVISLFDGCHSIEDIQRTFAHQFGVPISERDIKALIAQLDKNYMLHNENSGRLRQKIAWEFQQATLRRSSHAGIS